MLLSSCFFVLVFTVAAPAQPADTLELPYRQIPDYPDEYTPGNILSRLIDGLGYRYYWATEGLREEDLAFTPTEGARSALATLEHVYELSEAIVRAPQQLPNKPSTRRQALSYERLRSKTLHNLQRASALCRGKSAEEVADFAVIFQQGDRKSEFPYWHMLNGQIADALYHTGQLVSFRRMSGNPLPPGVNVFTGKTRP